MRRSLIGAGLILLGVGAALFLALTRTEVRWTLAQGAPATVLLLVRTGIPAAEPGPDLAMLVSLTPQGRCAWILVPGALRLPAAGGWSSLKDLGARQGGAAVAAALAALWELAFLAVGEVAPAGWEAWVQGAGGAVARPAERRVVQDPARQVFLDIPAGEQLLDGRRSREYLAYLLGVGGSPDLPGLRAFFEDFLARFYGQGELLRRALPLPGLSPWAVRDFWEGVARAEAQVEVVPAVAEEGGLLPDLVRIRKVRERLVSGRVFLTREEVRIFVVNGTRERFLATRTAAWLAGRGFQVVGVGPADRADYAKTFLLVRRGGEAQAELVRAVLPKEVGVIAAEAFGMERLGGWPEGADVVLLLGVGFDVGA